MKGKSLYSARTCSRVSIAILILFIVSFITGCAKSSQNGNRSTGYIGNESYNIAGEKYASNEENSLMDVSKNAVSTFSIDVDTASYSNIRRFINDGVKPPQNAVRIEEMINYFSYNYPEPTGEEPFSVTSEVGACPWDKDKYIAMVGLKGKEIKIENKPLSNLVFLIDVSGSMSDPDKLPLLKSAFKLLVEQLGENDRVSIVVYAGASGVVLDGARGDQKEKILSALDKLESGGSTAGAEGIQKAYELAQKYMISNGNNRILLASDGDFNVGISNVDDLKKLIEDKRKTGIYLSVLGFGTGNINDEIMETLADSGNGNYSYIDTISEARKVLVEQMSGTLLTIAKDVKIQVEFNPKVVVKYRLIGYENRMLDNEDYKDDKKDAGEIGAGHTVTAFYEIVPVAGMKKDDKLFDLGLRYKTPGEEVSKEIKRDILFEAKDKNSTDFNFAAAVVEFGLIVRQSAYKGTATLDGVTELAAKNIGEDKGGYRTEFLQLVRKYEDLK